MRWKQKDLEGSKYWVRGFGFAIFPRKVYASLDQKEEVWIWLERYARISCWNFGHSWYWTPADSYLFEFGALVDNPV